MIDRSIREDIKLDPSEGWEDEVGDPRNIAW